MNSFRRFSRETRLLILTMVVSGVVLLLLARLRFPVPPTLVDASAQPLERLAARASFEGLALQVAQLEATIAPSLIVLRLGADAPTPVRMSDLTLQQSTAGRSEIRHVPALRIDATTAIAAIPPSAYVSAIVGPGKSSGPAEVAAADFVHHLARLKVPEGPVRPLATLALSTLQAPAYLVVVEGTRAGVTLRPIFLGRADRFQSPRWPGPLLPLAGTAVMPGALLFTLQGEFLGWAVMEEATTVLAAASDVFELTARLGASPRVVDSGLAVQPLTAALAAATGVAAGVMVAEVQDDSSAGGLLQTGDVITAIDRQPVDDPSTLLLQLGSRLALGPVEVAYVRARKPATVRLSPVGADLDTAAAPEPALRSVPGQGTRIATVPHGSAFHVAGLAVDDLIVRAGGIQAPAPADVQRWLAEAPADGFVLLVVRRGDRQQVIAVRPRSRREGARDAGPR